MKYKSASFSFLGIIILGMTSIASATTCPITGSCTATTQGSNGCSSDSTCVVQINYLRPGVTYNGSCFQQDGSCTTPSYRSASRPTSGGGFSGFVNTMITAAKNLIAPAAAPTPVPAEAEINRLSPCNENTSEKTNRAAYCTCDYGDDQDEVDAYNKCKKDGTSKNKEDCKTAELLKKIEDIEKELSDKPDAPPKCFTVHYEYPSTKTEEKCYSTVGIAVSCAYNGGDSFDPFPGQVHILCSDTYFPRLAELINLFKKQKEANECLANAEKISNRLCCANNKKGCDASNKSCESPYVKTCSNSNDKSL